LTQEREDARKALLGSFDEALGQGRLVPPPDEGHALGYLRQIQESAGASPEYAQAEKRFLEAMTQRMQQADQSGDVEGGLVLARYIVQLQPEHPAASELLKRPPPAPPVTDAGLDAADVAMLDGGTPDAAMAAADAPSTPDVPAADPTPPADPPPAEVVKEDKPPAEETPPKEVPAEDVSAKKEEVKKLMEQAGRLSGAQALPIYRKVLQLEPGNARANFNIGATLSEQGNFAGALPYLERAVRASGRNAAYRMQLGNAYKRAGQEAKAREQYQKVLEIDPENKVAKRMLGN
jgi:tetratricopeptide (TPR) repeat protein